MASDALHDFFIASVGASATLIGLLFVAISIAPEHVFGTEASGNAQAFAVGTFIMLSNIFFISLAGLLPHLNIGLMVLVMGAIGLVNSLLLMSDVWQLGFKQTLRGLILTAGSLAIYGFEVDWGIQLLRHPGQVAVFDDVTDILLIAYAVALARSWELLGGKDYSLIRSLFA